MEYRLYEGCICDLGDTTKNWEYSWKMRRGWKSTRLRVRQSLLGNDFIRWKFFRARAGGRPIFTLREINARFTRCYSGRIYVFVGSRLFRSTGSFPPLLLRPRNSSRRPSLVGK